MMMCKGLFPLYDVWEIDRCQWVGKHFVIVSYMQIGGLLCGVRNNNHRMLLEHMQSRVRCDRMPLA